MTKHNKDLLHHTKLLLFRDWVLKQGYIQHERPEDALYEVLRIEEYDPSGNNPHLVFYKKERNDHLSIPFEAKDLVKRFLDEVRTPKQKNQAKKRKARKHRKIAEGFPAEKIGRMSYAEAQKLDSVYKASRPSKDAISTALEMAENMDLSDGAYWAVVHDLLKLDYGDVFPLMEEYGMFVPTTEEEKR